MVGAARTLWRLKGTVKPDATLPWEKPYFKKVGTIKASIGTAPAPKKSRAFHPLSFLTWEKSAKAAKGTRYTYEKWNCMIQKREKPMKLFRQKGGTRSRERAGRLS